MWSNLGVHGINRNTFCPTQVSRETPQDGLSQSERASVCRVRDQAFQLMPLGPAFHLGKLTMAIPPTHLSSEAHTPPRHTNAQRIAPRPRPAALLLPPSSPRPTKKLPVDVPPRSVRHR